MLFSARLLKSWGCSSVGRALEWHSRGQGFDSPQLHHKKSACKGGFFMGEIRSGESKPERARSDQQTVKILFAAQRGEDWKSEPVRINKV